MDSSRVAVSPSLIDYFSFVFNFAVCKKKNSSLFVADLEVSCSYQGIKNVCTAKISVEIADLIKNSIYSLVIVSPDHARVINLARLC